MADIRKKNHIKVMNLSTSQVCVTGRLRGYLFPSCRDGIPSFEYMDFEDIEYINSKSPVFRNGDLQFEDCDRDELFEALKYPKWRETYLDEEMMEDILHNPTTENLKRVVGITSPCTMERLRAKLISAINNDADGVSTRVANVIKQRFRELQSNRVRSAIQLDEPVRAKAAPDELAELRAQNDNLQAQINALMELMSAKDGQEPKAQVETKPKKPTQAKSKAAVENQGK